METISAQELLNSAYSQLGYQEGSLYDANNDPNNFLKGEDQKVWIEKGEWLSLAKQVDAEKIFFVDNNPVIVFKQTDKNEPDELRKIFNDIWCMSRPRLLFLAMPGELAVYDLANQPVQSQKDWERLDTLGVAKSINEVALKLKAFRREQIESGQLFEEERRFGDLKNRADKALIHDLKEIRKELIDNGLSKKKIKYAHALIGRSIFIRYLEDRGILTSEDFQEIASQKEEWKEILKNEIPRPGLNLSGVKSLYARVLSDKDFTFSLFKKLAKDFNGDMFPDIKKEKKFITLRHLRLVQDLLFGDVGKQKNLFFYAYQFKIIPIELISSIYEEFYHPEASEEKNMIKSSEGAYYTPPSLVEFLVNQILTPERLKIKPPPRILDPACGSGIFLVEAFRRIVRQRCLELGRRPNFQNLQVILREQIAGIEINTEAIRITAFSLYLAMLHYLDPPSIREQIYERGNRLPNLIFKKGKQKETSCNTLLAKNAFDTDYIENNPILHKFFLSNCADIVIGNPPWGSPGPKKEDKEARKANTVAVEWCNKRRLPIGDQERSQSFIWRALDILKNGGSAALLVSTGVFLKYQRNSVEFRKKWLASCNLKSVFSFVHTRTVFFNGAISPFAAIFFEKSNQNYNSIDYWTSKKTKLIEGLHSVVFRKYDHKTLHPSEDMTDHKIWKIYLWGSHRDQQLIRHFETNVSLSSLSNKNFYGDGYTRGTATNSKWLLTYKTLTHQVFDRYITRYGRLNLKKIHLEYPPRKVKTRGKKETYYGMRLIFKETIDQSSKPKGMVIVRLEDEPFSFTDSFFGIKLNNIFIDDYKCILGICWSSLARYYWFLTSSNWGVWRDKLLCGQTFDLPIKIPNNGILKSKIINIVNELQSFVPEEARNLFQDNKVQRAWSKKEITQLEEKLDDEIFKLYELDDSEIDLINEMCDIDLPYYYSPETSLAGKPVLTTGSLSKKTEMADYTKIFCECWEAYLDEDTEFCWQVYQSDKTDSMIAVEFSIQMKGGKSKNSESWSDVLQKLEDNLTQSFHSSRIYIEGLVRVVTEDKKYIIIIKRNEKWLWTRSRAREDAEATLEQAMNLKSREEKAANE